jgi:hypothetical protein
MPLDVAAIRKLLSEFAFKELFIEHLGWDHSAVQLTIPVGGQDYLLTAIAQKRGMVAYHCEHIPDQTTRRKIERETSKRTHEHLILYTDNRHAQIWQWIKREVGRPTACREHPYHVGQPGDSLIQKLQNIAFGLDEEATLTLPDVTGRVRQAFDVERLTRRFYERFKEEHADFLRFLKGIPDQDMQRWYVSVMLNRLMFVYFIQKKIFLNSDLDYLKNKLTESKSRGKDRFYCDFLCPLFFEGFAKRPQNRSAEMNRLLGKVPYLNGGIFMKHQIEQLHGQTIEISDKAFDNLFGFFDEFHWHLDDRPTSRDNEIRPDVLGYIFEKYINQKQMGAYYTKEDITEYIGKNTILPHLMDKTRERCKVAFEGPQSVWRLLRDDPNRYIYPSIQHGITLNIHRPQDTFKTVFEPLDTPVPLPAEIAYGLNDISSRSGWNRSAASEVALPTETWREVILRRKRYDDLYDKLNHGRITEINDLITCNLDIRRFAQDLIESAEGPELIRAFWKALHEVTILDPACGSGAFLFAALNILEPLYEACLDRMRAFLDELDRSETKHDPKKYADFRETIQRIDEHPNERYFVLKSIVINNLYGVDIMEEATEICKLRLFLKLVAQIDRVGEVEPLPDIDFNIRAGNTLVGFASIEEVRHAVKGKSGEQGNLVFTETQDQVRQIEEDAEIVNKAFQQFRRQQTELGGTITAEDKRNLSDRLNKLAQKLDRFLAGEYKINLVLIPNRKKNEDAFQKWHDNHKPFHWFAEFYGILKNGGFDVIIGNPPYVEYSKVKMTYTIRSYSTESCGNLYAFVWERCLVLAHSFGTIGMIQPVAAVCTDGYEPMQSLLHKSGTSLVSNFNDRPSKLFDGLEHIRLCIVVHRKGSSRQTFSTTYNKWQSVERMYLFHNLSFVDTSLLNMDGTIAKVGTDIESSILARLCHEKGLLNEYERDGKWIIYYTRKLSHFVQILDFIPMIKDAEGHKREPSELKDLHFASKEHRDVFLCILNSSLFYWLLTVYSDCRNLNRRDINFVRFDFGVTHNEETNHLQELASTLMDDIRAHSKILTMKYKDMGEMRIQCTYPKFSKSIIDKIDQVLAKHYGLTDEELDFIINYDIKYRMGIDSEEEA